jgi:chemotaxis methyl-accepting protein methylase
VTEGLERVLSELLRRRLGHGGPWPVEVRRHVSRMAKQAGSDELSWLRDVEQRAQDWSGLLAAATVGHTKFFRHPEHYERLAARAQEVAAARGTVRVWSAGCSSGEEPWSIALCLDELGVEFSILATDVNPRAVEKARLGSYPARETVGVAGYDGARALLLPRSLAARMRFEVLALGQVLPVGAPHRFDFVFCRNVLIYFDVDELPGIHAFLADHVERDGALVMSPVETLGQLPLGFRREGPLGWLERLAVQPPARRSKPSVTVASIPQRASIVARSELDRALDDVATHLADGQLEQAERLLHQVLEKRDDAWGWFLLGEACTRRGERTQARIAFERATRGQHVPTDLDLDTIRRAAGRRAQMLTSG